MLEIILIFLFITTLLIFHVILKYMIAKKTSILRLKKYVNEEAIRLEKEQKKPQNKEFKSGLGVLAKKVGNARFLDKYRKNTHYKLSRAHILLKPEEFISLKMILSGSIGFVFFVLGYGAVLFGIAGGVAGWILPSIFLNMKIKKRIKYLNDQLGDAIVLVSNSLKAGYSFFQAVDVVSREMSGPIAEEFATLQKEINLGNPTEKALENLVSRVQSDDLELVVAAVLIQRQVGGNLAEILDNISSTIRERVRIKGEVRTVTAQGRISGLIISLLPFVLGAILFLIYREHILILFTDSFGIGILCYSIFMELLGIYFISKIVKIQV